MYSPRPYIECRGPHFGDLARRRYHKKRCLSTSLEPLLRLQSFQVRRIEGHDWDFHLSGAAPLGCQWFCIGFLKGLSSCFYQK